MCTSGRFVTAFGYSSAIPRGCRIGLAAVAILLLCADKNARAELIKYTLALTADGSIGDTSFTDAQVTLRTFSDTNNIVVNPGSSNSEYYNPGVTQIIIQGVPGIQAFVQDQFGVQSEVDTSGANNGYYYLGMWDISANRPIGFITVPLPQYTLSTPVTLTSLADAGEYLFQTTAGQLSMSITDQSFSGTFTAEYGSYPVAPEPSSIAIASLGGLGLVGYLLRRKAI